MISYRKRPWLGWTLISCRADWLVSCACISTMHSPESVNIVLSNFIRAFVRYAKDFPLQWTCHLWATVYVFINSISTMSLWVSYQQPRRVLSASLTIPGCILHNALSSCFEHLPFHSLRPCCRRRCSPQARCSHYIKPTKCALHDADNRFLLINWRPFQYRFACLRDGFDDNDRYPYWYIEPSANIGAYAAKHSQWSVHLTATWYQERILTDSGTLDVNALPIQPTITPSIGITGVVLMITGMAYNIVGIKNQW